jgi:putative transposase
MANTYTQLYAHVVFAVKGRKCCIGHEWKNNLFQYITGIVTNKGQKIMSINGVGDHIHILIGFNPECAISSLIRDIKANSSRWINREKLINSRFEWQKGFGAFTIGQSQVGRVANYIENQEKHHQKKSFGEEYIAFLKAYEIDYDPKFLI